MVCIAVASVRKLQNYNNYFLFSLAVADLMVSVLVMPMGLAKDFVGKLRCMSIKEKVNPLMRKIGALEGVQSFCQIMINKTNVVFFKLIKMLY